MTESGNSTRGKIQAAKQWLSRAEDHFDRNAPVRGEMDLMLAEAELRSTRESLKTRPRRLNLSWSQQGIAFGMAALIMATAAGAAWRWQDDRLVNVQPPVAYPAVPVRQVQTQNTSAAPLQISRTLPAAAADATIPGREVKTIETSASREPSVSEDEMKLLIQTAGQSLRGRTKL